MSVAALRGEIGSSNILMRDIKTKLKYARCVLNGGTGNLTKSIYQDMFDKGKDRLVRQVRGYMEDLEIGSLHELKTMSDAKIGEMIDLLDLRRWKEELGTMSTLVLYCQHK